MKTIDLNQASLIDTKATSSKGNQLKWLVRNNWYKADHMGYEGLCEVVVSRLLKKSNIDSFVSYSPIRISFDDREMNGCYSKNFRRKNESLVTLEHLSKQWLAESMAKELTKYPDVKDKIKHTVFDFGFCKNPECRNYVINGKSDYKSENGGNTLRHMDQLAKQYHYQHIHNGGNTAYKQAPEKLDAGVAGIPEK